MFSFLLERKRVFSLVAACLAALALFSACEPDADPLLGGAPVGTWVSEFGETYVIGNKDFELKKSFGGSISYRGTITGFREDGLGNGYITIKYIQYTEYSDDYTTSTLKDAGENEYYVIHWKGLRAGSVELSDAYGEKGTIFQESDLSAITVANGYFDIHSPCIKQ